MTCPTIIDPLCKLGDAILGGASKAITAPTHLVVNDFLGTLADGVQKGVMWLFTKGSTWWLGWSSPDLTSEPAVDAMRHWLLPVTLAVAIGGMIAAGVRMALTRRHAPLLDAGTGLAAIAAAGTIGVIVPTLLLQAGDSWSSWVLSLSSGSVSVTDRMNLLMATVNSAIPSVIIIVFGIFALLLSGIQLVLLVFRQAAVIILAAMLPLAAAGATAPLTRPWLRKLTSWMLALIMFKPAAAAVYATAFTLIGNGENMQATITGLMMVLLAPLTMPVLMRFFTWTTGTVSSGGGGGQFLGMAASGAIAMGALRGASGGSGSSASEHASHLSSEQQASVSASRSDLASTGATSAAGSQGQPSAAPPTNKNGPGEAGNSAKGAAPAGGQGGAAEGGTTGAAAASSAGESVAGAIGTTASAVGTAATTLSSGGVAMAAMMAAGGLANGAKGVAGSASDEGDRR